MLARDWYYNERRQIGLDSAVASIYDRHDDRDLRARAALTMLGCSAAGGLPTSAAATACWPARRR
jgi:hypothetical protein